MVYNLGKKKLFIFFLDPLLCSVMCYATYKYSRCACVCILIHSRTKESIPGYRHNYHEGKRAKLLLSNWHDSHVPFVSVTSFHHHDCTCKKDLTLPGWGFDYFAHRQGQISPFCLRFHSFCFGQNARTPDESPDICPVPLSGHQSRKKHINYSKNVKQKEQNVTLHVALGAVPDN